MLNTESLIFNNYNLFAYISKCEAYTRSICQVFGQIYE